MSYEDKIVFARDPDTGKLKPDPTALTMTYTRLIRSPGCVGREVGDLARAFITDEVRKLHFATPGRSYEETSKEISKRYPQIATLAHAPIGDDETFARSMGLEFVECAT